MSLKLFQSKATLKQLAWLREHDYFGSLELTKTEAGQLIEEYIEQERISMSRTHRDFIARLNNYDPQYLEKYRQFKQKGIL